MSVGQLREFLDEIADTGQARWWLKRLSANDTQGTHAHQAGPYVPRAVMFSLVPELNRPTDVNPREYIHATVHPQQQTATVHAIWYNNKLRSGTRNETRITNWGGSSSPFLDPSRTGYLAIFAFGGNTGSRWCHAWVCQSEDEEDFAEERFGTVEPGHDLVLPPMRTVTPRTSCWLEEDEIPNAWMETFPSPAEIMQRSFELHPEYRQLPPDRRLINRRNCEWELFQSVESAFWLPVIREGFTSVETFLSTAQTLAQRRKARSGRSLERHLSHIFGEAGFLENIHFDQQAETEMGNRPDFLFPSEAAYHDESFDSAKLRMLAAKTSMKERWSQVLREADRVHHKHLLTLQHGVPQSQFDQIQAWNIQLVVPKPLHRHYLKPIRQHLQTLEDFIAEVKVLSEPSSSSSGVAGKQSD